MHRQTYKGLEEAREFMRDAYARPIGLSEVAARAHLSPYHFSRLYRSRFEETPHEFLTRLRIGRAKTLLARGSHNVTEACFEVGFTSLGSFSSLFLRRVGLAPSEYRRHARSGVPVPRDVRPLFVPSCFASMVYGPPKSAKSEKRAAASGVIFASRQRTEENRDTAPEPLHDLRY